MGFINKGLARIPRAGGISFSTAQGKYDLATQVSPKATEPPTIQRMSSYKIIDTNQRERGPFDAGRICERIADGRSDAQTPVQVEGSGEWKRLGELPEFAGALRAAAASPESAKAPPPSPDDLLPVLRVFPAFEYTSAERVEDVLAVYPDAIVYFQKKRGTEIPVEAGELEDRKSVV